MDRIEVRIIELLAQEIAQLKVQAAHLTAMLEAAQKRISDLEGNQTASKTSGESSGGA